MKNIKLAIFLLVVSLMAVGCNETQNNITAVKEGTFITRNAITIGQAFDNWESCEKSEWNQETTSNGIQIVEFTCWHKVVQFMDRLKELDKKYQTEFTPDLYDITEHRQAFQFVINLDDTFKLNAIHSKFTWQNGKYYVRSDKINNEIKNAYSNQPTWNMFLLENLTQDSYQELNMMAWVIFSSLRQNAIDP